MNEHLRRIANKHWIYNNKRLLRLPFESRKILVDMAKDDVAVCIRNSGMHDSICLDMAQEASDMEEYLLWSR